MSHRVCYTRFSQFEDHADNIVRMVEENVATIDAYIETLKESYNNLINIESELTATRSNIRHAQKSQQELEIA